jgi:hypothetical protein
MVFHFNVLVIILQPNKLIVKIMKTHPRRAFLKGSAAAVAGIGLSSALGACSTQNTDLSNKFVHHVFFWLKEPDNKEAVEKCRQGLEKLVTIDTIRYKHIAMPANTSREVIDSSYQFSLLTVFDDEAGHNVYQEHETHQEFIRDYSDLWERVLVYDSCNC